MFGPRVNPQVMFDQTYHHLQVITCTPWKTIGNNEIQRNLSKPDSIGTIQIFRFRGNSSLNIYIGISRFGTKGHVWYRGDSCMEGILVWRGFLYRGDSSIKGILDVSRKFMWSTLGWNINITNVSRSFIWSKFRLQH